MRHLLQDGRLQRALHEALRLHLLRIFPPLLRIDLARQDAELELPLLAEARGAGKDLVQRIDLVDGEKAHLAVPVFRAVEASCGIDDADKPVAGDHLRQVVIVGFARDIGAEGGLDDGGDVPLGEACEERAAAHAGAGGLVLPKSAEDGVPVLDEGVGGQRGDEAVGHESLDEVDRYQGDAELVGVGGV